jgi:hypothetical protein
MLAAWSLAFAGPTAACQCFTPDPMAEVATQPQAAVLTGTPGDLIARGVPIEVHRWIHGQRPQPVIWLAAWSIGLDEEACDGPPPVAGIPLLLVLEMPKDGSDPYGGKCAQISRLVEPVGQAALAEAVAVFGGGLAFDRPPPGALEVGPGDQAGESSPSILAVLLGLAAGAGAVAALWSLAARRRGSGVRPPGSG